MFVLHFMLFFNNYVNKKILCLVHFKLILYTVFQFNNLKVLINKKTKLMFICLVFFFFADPKNDPIREFFDPLHP